ncbi:hypothetical protein NDU88_006432 [Pleurodeles waltl]|uniref:Uncharacterized protein n=1 Tax=Pleurodeles waltl TaxID=8319 RepID=A0AAV7TX37_PLEWA|nr:hypothetical protein NDU88_006432 [Pleurodeles waltl]
MGCGLLLGRASSRFVALLLRFALRGGRPHPIAQRLRFRAVLGKEEDGDVDKYEEWLFASVSESSVGAIKEEEWKQADE